MTTLAPSVPQSLSLAKATASRKNVAVSPGSVVTASTLANASISKFGSSLCASTRTIVRGVKPSLVLP